MIKKREFIWNTIGSFIQSLFNAIILAFCTRLNTIEIAGIFSISYATACILNAVGDFGLRIYQVTDTERKNSFSDYLSIRLVVQALMFILGMAFILIKGYTSEKLIICLLLFAYRAIENISECYQAKFQLNGRLQLGGKSIVYRNVAGLILFFVIDLFTRNVIISLASLVFINLLIFVFYDLRLIKNFFKDKFKPDWNKVKKIFIDCLPLALSTLISMYVLNAVKYAIDGSGDYTMQTYFNILYMPTFVINLISLFIIKPFLKPFGESWNSNEFSKFLKMILIIVGVLLLATICVEIGCYILGIPFLNLLYGVELSMYKSHLLLLIVSGFLYASSNVFFYALGTMRSSKLTTITYVLTAVFALFMPKMLVEKYYMSGAVASSIVIMSLLFVFMAVFFFYVYFKEYNKFKKKNNKCEKSIS